MPGSTPFSDYPIPVGTDYVRDGDNAMRNLANTLDGKSCQAYQTVAASLPTAGTIVLMSLVGESWDDPTVAMHDTATNPSRIYARSTGVYVITACVGMAAVANGSRTLYLQKNGNGDISLATGSTLGYASEASPASGVNQWPAIIRYARLVVGDYVEMFARAQGAAANVATSTGENHTYLAITRVA